MVTGGDSTTDGSTSSSTTLTTSSTSTSSSEITGLNPVCPTVPGRWSPQALPAGRVGVQYDVEITAENWDGTVQAFIDGLPEGLSQEETSDGVRIVGVPSEVGIFQVSVQTFTGDGGNCWPPKSYELVIDPEAGTGTGSSTDTGGSTGTSGSTTSG